MIDSRQPKELHQLLFETFRPPLTRYTTIQVQLCLSKHVSTYLLRSIQSCSNCAYVGASFSYSRLQHLAKQNTQKQLICVSEMAICVVSFHILFYPNIPNTTETQILSGSNETTLKVPRSRFQTTCSFPPSSRGRRLGVLIRHVSK